MILSSLKIIIIFNNTSDEIQTKSADVLSKILSELRIAQLCASNERTLALEARLMLDVDNT